MLPALLGAPLHGPDGSFLGTVADVALDAQRRPAWLALHLPSGHAGLVPATALVRHGRGYALPALTGPPVRSAPGTLPAGPALTALRRHFAVLGPAGPPVAWLHGRARATAAA
jgi:hypothetical protein